MTRLRQHASILLASGLVTLAATGSQSLAQSPPPGPVATVPSRSHGLPTPEGGRLVDDEPALRPNHPPIASIPPIPRPGPATGGPMARTGGTLYHDAAADVTYQLPLSTPSGLSGQSGPGYRGADGGLGDEGLPPPSFVDMTLISDTSAHPWRMNCKLVMRFVDQLGQDRWFVASGAMMDAETVITAAHCVYARETDTTDIFDWAEEIWVYPGWDGDGEQFAEPPSTVHNYGFGHGTQFMAGTDYVDDGDFDGDCAPIRITRGVGMLTGWYGYTWGGSCSWIQDRTYGNASYPSENCPIQGLHNGSDMYYWYGTIDSCPFNQMQLNSGTGCFDTGWGGMSGSGIYWINDGRRHVHAVDSTSNEDHTRFCVLWEEFVTNMLDSFVPASRGSTFDLQALDVNIEPVVVAAGSPLTLANFLAANPTNGSAAGTWTYRVYLSTNDNISSSDLLLDTLDFDASFGPMGSFRVYIPFPTIPLDTPPGDYWIGVILDAGTDADAGNNDTDGWDATAITVIDHCFSPPVYDSTIVPSSSWQTRPVSSFEAQGCRVFRMTLYPGYAYDFSLCGDDGVGGWANPGDADMRMYDADGFLYWYIDGQPSCDYDSSTIGSTREGWSPPAEGVYYLEVSDYFDEAMEYRLAYRYETTEHCYEPPDYDRTLSPASTWRKTLAEEIAAPGGCRMYRMYLSKVLQYDFSACLSDGVGGWAAPGNADLYLRDSGGNLMWYLLGQPGCDDDATTLGTAYEAWTPPHNGYYYLQVLETFDQAMTFRLAYRITTDGPPPHDDCVDVTPVPLEADDAVLFDGISVGATTDSDLLWPEVWHAFTTTECTDITLSYCQTTPPFEAIYWVLKDECPAVGPNVFASSYDNEACGNGNWTIRWEDLPPGTYWYPVLSVVDNEGEYFIIVRAASCDGCVGDLDADGQVDFQDLLQLLGAWGPCVGCPADLDGDHAVDFQDLLTLLGAWGTC